MKKTTGISLLTALILTFVPVSADPPDVTRVEPSQGYLDEDTEVTLTGDGFDLEASVLLTGGGLFLAGIYDTPGAAQDVAVAGDYGYVADRSGGLQVIDVSNPQAPELIGSRDTPGYALGVAVAGDYAYVVDRYSGLQVIHVSNPQAPVLVGTYDTPGQAYGVALAGGYAYVGDWDSGLQVIDVSSANAPALAGSYDTPNLALGVAVAGGYGYVADSYSGLQIVRLNPPIRNVSYLSETRIHLMVPAGFMPGPYDVRVTNPGSEPDTLRNGFRACERRVLGCTLQSLNDSRFPRPWPGTTPTTWRLMLDGDDVFFPPRPRHEALLLLPELPSTIETRFEVGHSSDRLVIQLGLFPESDYGVVRLIGDDPDALAQLWDKVGAAGGVGLPRLDNRSYGDIDLSHNSQVAVTVNTGIVLVYRYTFSDGQLTEARAFGPGADLVLEVVARDEYHCKTVERISLLEAMGGPTN